jgi:hypothetical protein
MQSQLVALKIFRRTVTAAIFSGTRLQFLDLQHLSNDPNKASETLSRFVGWTLENFRPELAALSVEEEDDKPRAAMLAGLVEKQLLSHGVPVWKITDQEMLEAYASPALAQKHTLRLIARSIWPDVSIKLPALDAALVGLFVQTERLLSSH